MFARRTSWQSELNRFTQALDKRKREGGEVFDLTESNPTRCGFECPTVPIPDAPDYAPEAQGLRSARDAVSAYYAERGETVPAERLLLTTSTSEAYTWIFRLLCDPGDEVLVPAPSYPLFEYLASIQDVTPVRYPLFYDHGWHVDLHTLEQAITARTRAILVVNPNNPTGSYVSAVELKAMNQLCAARNLALVADEVFLDFPWDGNPRTSLATNPGALTFTLSGLSKIAGLPQMKVAWMAVGGPEALVRQALARLEIIADTCLSMNAPIQLALPELLKTRTGFQRQVSTRMGENLKALDAALTSTPAVVRLAAEGGWYAALRTPQPGGDEELAIALLEEQGVVVHPGHFYDFARDGHLLLSLIPLSKGFEEGVRRLAVFLATRFR